MLAAVGGIDVIIPRGGRSLVERVQNEARVPVFAHLEGICHLYVDAAADPDKAEALVVNAKMRRVEICGAAETLLIDRAIAASLLPRLADALTDAGCRLVADTRQPHLSVTAARQQNRISAPNISTASLPLLLLTASVRRLIISAGIAPIIPKRSSPRMKPPPAVFLKRSIRHCHGQCLTQFADGGEFGMGAEIGISTGRMHARGLGARPADQFQIYGARHRTDTPLNHGLSPAPHRPGIP